MSNMHSFEHLALHSALKLHILRQKNYPSSNEHVNIAQLQIFSPQITKMSQFLKIKTRAALTPYYSIRAFENMLYESLNIPESPDICWKAKAHCSRRCNLHISLFSMLILSFTFMNFEVPGELQIIFWELWNLPGCLGDHLG